MTDINQSEQKTGNSPELIDIKWQAPEFEKFEKGPGWFIMLGIAALIIFTVILWTTNYIFAVLIVIMVFIVYVYALKEPRIVTFQISRKGITINDKVYPFEELRSFWIFFEPPDLKELSVKSKKWLMPLIRIPLDNQNPTLIRSALLKFIPELKQEQSVVDIVARRLRF